MLIKSVVSDCNASLLDQVREDTALYFDNMTQIYEAAKSDNRIKQERTFPDGTRYYGSLRNNQLLGQHQK